MTLPMRLPMTPAFAREIYRSTGHRVMPLLCRMDRPPGPATQAQLGKGSFHRGQPSPRQNARSDLRRYL